MSSSTKYDYVYPAMPVLEAYIGWSVCQLLHEARRRPTIRCLFDFPEPPSVSELPLLLAFDDSEHNAAQGHYEMLNNVQLQYQCEMRGITPCNNRTTMLRQLWALDERTRQLEYTDYPELFAESAEEAAYPSPQSPRG
jgi:hypothetical protein